MEDLRNHDPRPTESERQWMHVDPVSLLVKVVAVAGFAIAIGVSATQMMAPTAAPSTVAATEH